MKRIIPALIVACVASAAGAQTGGWLQGPKPVFVPGLYETESRNSHFKTQPSKATVCIPSKDFDAFMEDTIAQYRSAPQFSKGCSLSEPTKLADGFAIAMACAGVKTVLTYHFSKDQVASTIDNVILKYNAASASILTMSRRIGDCPGQKSPV
jgi:hypothetical protein